MKYISIKDNKLTVDERLNEELKECFRQRDEIEAKISKLRREILDNLINEQLTSIETNDFKISQIIPKDKIIFDQSKFIENEDEKVVQAVTEQVVEEFDLDKFKQEQLEMYQQYVKRSRIIDSAKLSKFLPNIFEKYTSVEKSKRSVTIRIEEKKHDNN